MNILFCGDSNTERGIFLSILSLMKHVKEELCVSVLTMGWEYEGRYYQAIPEDFIRAVDGYMKKANKRNQMIRYDVSDCFADCVPEINMETRFTPYCMLRLFADQVSDISGRILYLDNDVLCRKDISAFYHQDINGCEFVGVLDYYGSWFFRNKLWKRDYVNSGVLLLNIDEIRKTGLFEKSREVCRDKKMFMPDQSAHNKLAQNKKLADRKYNEQRRLRKETAMQHFTTSFRFFPWLHTVTVKPWEFDKAHDVLKLHEYDELFQEFQSAGIPME